MSEANTSPKRETTPADDAIADVIAYLLRRMAEDEAARKAAAPPASDEAPIALEE